MGKIVQTAGREELGKFAPEFAHFNDDILFGEDWNNEDISLKCRAIITVVSLMASGILDSSLKFHMENAKKQGVTKKEIAAILTHCAFYVGWPKGWAAFRMAKEIWCDDDDTDTDKAAHQAQMVFAIGDPNDGFAQYFKRQSYLAPVSTEQEGIYNVTFEPGCINNWHIHHSDEGGGQILLCIAGKGRYGEWGKEVRELNPGDCVNIPSGVKHWHGAVEDSWFSHLSIEVPGKNNSTEWLEPVDLE